MNVADRLDAGNTRAQWWLIGCAVSALLNVGCDGEVEPPNEGSGCREDAPSRICVDPADVGEPAPDDDSPEPVNDDDASEGGDDDSGAAPSDDDTRPSDDDTRPSDDDTRPTDDGGLEPTDDDSGAVPDVPAPVTPSDEATALICDGSDEVRLVIRENAPPRFAPEESFVQRYGQRFLAVDGHCDYWLNRDAGLLRTGSITDASVLAGYASAVYGKLSELPAFEPPECSDPITTQLWDPSGAVETYSDCGTEGWPEDWGMAINLATALLDLLEDDGEPSTEALAISILPAPEYTTNFAAWPLSLDPTPVIDRRDPATVDWASDDKRVLFHAGADAETLRQTREMRFTSSYAFEYAPASGEPAKVSVMMRDEPPPRVRAALELTKQLAGQLSAIGAGCAPDLCPSSLQCSMLADDSGRLCSACLSPSDTDFACQSNDDCCDGLVCCVDCGAQSGTCMAAVDPCAACVERGGSWLPFDGVCAERGCEPDSGCITNECPAPCDADNCRGCFDEGECWAAACAWTFEGETGACLAADELPPVEPCEADATDPTLPGVAVHLEGDRCAFAVGQGGEFRYEITLSEPLDFTTLSSEGACGVCGSPSDLDTWVAFSIGGNGVSYCPDCDVGCCAPTEADPASVSAQTLTGTVDWPGLEFRGPSDTGNEPSGAFPPGEYSAVLVVELPGLGSVTASLPISVLADDD